MKWISAHERELIPASPEDAASPGVLKRVLAQRSEFQEGHVQMLNWAVLPGLSSFQPHYHEDMQEVFLVVHGLVEMRVAGEVRQMQPGDAVLVDPHEVHVMRNLQESQAEYIVFGISSGRGGRTINVRGDEPC